MPADVDFVVVGAGLAGLRAASDLAAGGASVAVFEARERVGGRTLTVHHPVAGGGRLALDLGAQWVGPAQTEALGLAAELGLTVIPTPMDGDITWFYEGELHRGGDELPPASPAVLEDLVRYKQSLWSMARTLPDGAPYRAAEAPAWDTASLADWLGRTLRTRAGAELAETLLVADLAVSPREVSLLGLLADLRSTGGRENLESAEAMRLAEGTQQLSIGLARPLRERIHLGEPVREITQEAGHVTVAPAGRRVSARAVAVCLPPVLAAELRYDPELPTPSARLLASLPMASSVKVHAVYDTPFWRDDGRSGTAVSAGHPVSITYDNSPPGGGPGVLTGLVVADQARRLHRLDEPAREREILASLGALFGDRAAGPAGLVVQDWAGEPWSRGCYAAYFGPGVWTGPGRAARRPCGRIHFACTDTAREWTGYMEGALREGRRVAAEMLAAY
jgi:monoamine oxidase